MDKRYTIDQLLDDQDFVLWVKTGKLGRTDWPAWMDFDQQNRDQAIKAKIIIESIEIEDAVEVMDEDVEALWTRIDTVVSQADSTSSESKSLIRRLAPIGIAAAIVIATSMILFFPKTTTIDTGYAENIQMELPDGSQVFLNADSKIRFSKKKWTDERKVELEGEAFFEVEKGSQFTVISDQGTTKVLGTSFNVLDRYEDFVVKCYTGRVEVTHTDESVILSSGDKSHLLDYGLEKSNFRVEDDSWREGRFEFVNADLAKVFDELERQFDIEIEASEELEKLKYSGFFETDQLESALYAVCWPMRLKSVQNGNTVVITKENE